MSAHEKNVAAALSAIKTRTLPPLVNGLALGGIAWGVAALGYGLTAGDKGWTLGALLVALVYTFSIAQGAMMLSVILTGTQARWGRGLKRIAESYGLYLPFAWVLISLFLVFGVDLYPWHPHTITGDPVSLAPHSPEAPHSKELWLSPTSFVVRNILVLGFMVLVDLWFLRASLKPDLIAARKELGNAGPAWWGWIVGNETDVAKAVADGEKTMGGMVPLMGFSYALVMSNVAFDLIMSLDPWWFSNMFGGWTFMSALWGGLALIAVTTMLSLDWLSLRSFVKPNTTHDLGRFMLAGTMFWGYTLYAQILPIWYADMPEETGFLMVRLMLPQWIPLSKVVAILCFIAPFTILLSRGIKKMRWPFAGIAGIILMGLFLERSLLVMPSVWLEPTVPWGSFLFINLGLLAGAVGLMVSVVARVLSTIPAVPVTDPLLETHPWDVHVHSLDAHAHH